MSLLHTSKKKSVALFFSLVLGISSLFGAENNCDKRAFSIQVNDVVTINEVLNQLSDVCKFSTVAKDAIAAEELGKTINGINIKNMPFRRVFNLLLTENNLNYEYSNGVLRVSSLFTKTFKVDYITSVREGTSITKASTSTTARKGGDNGETKEGDSDNEITAKESFDFWKTLNEEITAVLNNGTEKYEAIPPIVNQNAGLVTVTATKSQINRVSQYIKELERRLKKQVMLDVSIISVTLDNSYKTGIDWSKFELGFGNYLPETGQYESSAGYNINGSGKSLKTAVSNGFFTVNAGLNFNIAGMINFLETNGHARVISSPKVLALHNQPALISVGTNFSYLVQSDTSRGETGTVTKSTNEEYRAFVGILLNILPEISDDNKIMLRINPSIGELVNPDILNNDTVIANLNKAPTAYERKLSTVAYVNDGDTVILGGLIDQTKDKKNNNVPFLSSIPIVGGLFKSTKDVNKVTELVFVITPHIVKDTSRPISDSLRELGYSKSIYE